MPATNALRLFTIGYSNKPIEHFLGLLRAHKIVCVRDIRTTPESSHVPHFGSRSLRHQLQRVGIEYRLDGDALGGHPKEKRLYRLDGRVDFALLENDVTFGRALRELTKTPPNRTTALACKEGDPLECPRFFLIGRLLVRQGIEVGHILQDGQVRTQLEGEQMMLKATGNATDDLFLTQEQQVQMAYERLMERYEHRLPP